MGIFDKAKDKVRDLAGEHGDKVDGVIDKAAEAIDDKTGGRYSDKLDKGRDTAKGLVDKAQGEGGEPPSRLEP